MTNTANHQQREQWNGDEASHWVDAADGYDAQLEPFGDALLAAMAVQPGEVVIDIGCGNGVTAIGAARIAKAVRGVDISAPMLAVARSRAAELGVTNVDFVEADAQICAFGPAAADVVMSRFGVMFFDDAPAAFANLNRALTPGGRIGFVSWQPLIDNEWLLTPGVAAATYVEIPPAETSTSADAPGMFSLSDPDAVRLLLEGAGFSRIEIAPIHTTMTLGGGGTVDETLAFLLRTGIARALFAGASDEQRALAVDAVRSVFAAHYEPGVGVRMGAAGWMVSGVKP